MFSTNILNPLEVHWGPFSLINILQTQNLVKYTPIKFKVFKEVVEIIYITSGHFEYSSIITINIFLLSLRKSACVLLAGSLEYSYTCNKDLSVLSYI